MSQLALASVVNSSTPSLAAASSSTLHNSRGYTPLLCDNSSHYYHRSLITCSRNVPLVAFGNCATFNKETRILSVSRCPYLQSDGYNLTSLEQDTMSFTILPRNLSQLNNYMCGPLNRKGFMCSQCADGFGPSITSFSYKCVNCTDAWYRVPLFLLLEFVPITVFYLVILAFQVSVTSPPMPCFIMCMQFVVAAVEYNYITPVLQHTVFNENWDFRLDIKIIMTLYGIFNLDLFHYNILPPFCLSSRLDPIDLAAILGYVSAFYPILLIFLTWICVELHGRNSKPLVLMWRPFHKCFTQFKRKWNAKNDLIDAFITFFFLSYNKIMFQVLLLSNHNFVTNITESGKSYKTYANGGIGIKTVHHLLPLLTAIVISVMYNILSLLLLFFYPSGNLRSCLSKLHLNLIAVDTFTDKVYGCYRNGLEGGRDMRRFASLYFFLRFAVCFLSCLSRFISRKISCFYFIGSFFFIITLIVALVKPYKKSYMTILDVLILFTLTVTCYTLALESQDVLLTAKIFLTAPFVLFISYVIVSVFHSQFQRYRPSFVHKFNRQNCSTCFKRIGNQHKMDKLIQNSFTVADTPKQPLVQPTCTVINYGTIEDDSLNNYYC